MHASLQWMVFRTRSPKNLMARTLTHDFVHRSQDRDVPDYLPNAFQLYKLHGSVDWGALLKIR